MGKELKLLGVVDESKYELDNRVYSPRGGKPGIKSNGLQRPYKGSQTMEKKTIVIGQMSNERDHTLESANRVYGNKGCCPTINTCGGGTYNRRLSSRCVL